MIRDALIVFGSVLLAELGDKTQIATLAFATGSNAKPLTVLVSAGSALVVSTCAAVLLGTLAREYLAMIPLKLVAGLAFCVIGAWNVYEHFSRV